jgi:SAM-dependent methyltransferase
VSAAAASLSASGLALLCPACRGALRPEPGRQACARCGRGYAQHDGILHLVTGEALATGYDPHYFDSLPQVEEEHFWFLARRQLIAQEVRRALPDWDRRPLFDLGCGSGGLLAYLERAGFTIAAGCDAHVQALQIARRRTAAPLVLVDEGRLPPLAPGVRLLGMFDVLEHLDDDRDVLGWVHGVLAPGGALVLTVPAHPFLFDEMDRLAHHRRRYRRRELRDKLRGAGFEVRTLTSFMAPLVPPLMALRSARRLTRLLRPRETWTLSAELRVVPGLNGLLRAVLAVERGLLRLAPMPFGTSLLAVAVKREA